MLKFINCRRGFTLVEIMVVVAIVALLASIAVPGYLRARSRSQATRVLDSLRMVAAAKDLYGLEASYSGSEPPAWSALQPFLKPGSELYNLNQDIFGNPFQVNGMSVSPAISATTFAGLSDVVDSDFFSPYGVGGE